MKIKTPRAYWSALDADRQADLRLVAGLAVALFALFSLVSIGSYFFTWTRDASVTDPLVGPVYNAGAGWGVRWARFWVGRSFGIGALAVVVFLSAWSLHLLRPSRPLPLRKWLLGSLGGAFVVSWWGVLVGRLCGWETVFGSGLGGRLGAALIGFLSTHVGGIVTVVALVAATSLWGYFLSDRFAALLQPRQGNKAAQGEGAAAEVMNEEGSEAAPVDAPVNAPMSVETPMPAEVPVPVEEPSVSPVVRDPQPFLRQDPAGAEAAAAVPEEEDAPFHVVQGEAPGGDGPLPRIDNRLDPPDGLPLYEFPSIDILGDHASSRHEVSQEELNRNNNKIRATLASYKIQVREVTAVVGPTVTLYKVYPAPGVKISAIKSLTDDIAISLHAKGVRITTLADSVGIEVANDKASLVPLKSLLTDDAFRHSKAELPVAIGYTISQQVKVFDLADAPHLLVAGATKQGKSVGLNVIVASLLYAKHPSELKFVFIDPKMVEFSSYARLLHHYLAVLPNAASEQEERDQAIVKNAKSAAAILQSLCIEMDARYELLSRAYVNNIKLYNDKYRDHHLRSDEGHRYLPYIVTVIDEYADLTMSVGAGPESKALARGITTSVIRLAQKGRAAGLHVILATQRPTVDVITGLIKANFPMRIAFRVTSRVDSSTILDQPGADKLIGRGDMLLSSGVETERVQCAFIENDEIVDLTKAVGDQIGYQRSYNTPFYLPEPAPAEGEEGGMVDMKNIDERFEEAARLIVTSQRGSTSDLQRRLGMGYAKAGRVMDQLQAAGIVGPQNGSKPREVLVKDLNELEELLTHFLA